jgi:hypothetical protein
VCGRHGRRMSPLGNGTTVIGRNCAPGGGPLSVDGVTWRKRKLSPSGSKSVELNPDPLVHVARSVAVRNANSAAWNITLNSIATYLRFFTFFSVLTLEADTVHCFTYIGAVPLIWSPYVGLQMYMRCSPWRCHDSGG